MPQTRFPRLSVGSRPAAGAPETERDEPTPRQWISYCCPRGHTFDVPFTSASDVEVDIPDEWECRRHSAASRRADAEPEQKAIKAPRTHWVMLRERRTIPELHALLQERLTLLGHGSQLDPLPPTATSRHR